MPSSDTIVPSKVSDLAASGAIELDAPARLHLGFIDPGGDGGRRFGSIGLAIDSIGVRLRARVLADGVAHGATTVRGPAAARIEKAIEIVRRATATDTAVRVDVIEAIPEHVGLGSGTQAALAAGTVFSELSGSSLPPRAIAAMLERGARSGIGLAAFERGGFVVDGGRRVGDESDDAPSGAPPTVSRLDFPAHWRILLLFDRAARGLHGESERAAFRALAPFPPAAAARLAHRVLMGMLPGLVEHRLDEFGAALAEVQDTIGDHFAAAQGGRFASPRVARAIELLRAAGIGASGQSSWGPTGFAIVAGEDAARDGIERLGRDLPPDIVAGLTLRVVRGRNHGALRALRDAQP